MVAAVAFTSALALRCALNEQPWTGMLGQQRMECCLRFSGEDTPPPNRSPYLDVNASCSVGGGPIQRLYGWDSNGPITMTLCDDSQMECCELAAIGPSVTDVEQYTPTPTFMAGTYRCGSDPVGVFALQPGECSPTAIGSACPRVRHRKRRSSSPWTGMLGQEPLQCDINFQGSVSPPPNDPVKLRGGGPCLLRRVSRLLLGTVRSGSIVMSLCNNYNESCCQLRAPALAYPDPDIVPYPDFIAGTYQCEDQPMGVFALQPKRCRPNAPGSACPRVRRKAKAR